MILQLNSPIPVTTPKGTALAHFLIDEGTEHDLKWVCFQDNTGECWTWKNRDIRAQKNITQGRDYISPFYDPDDVALKKPEEIKEEYTICNRCLNPHYISYYFDEKKNQFIMVN
jgi:hypothetical protein